MKAARPRQQHRKSTRRNDAAVVTAPASPARMPGNDVHAAITRLQRTHGNAYVSRLIASQARPGAPIQRDDAKPLSLSPRGATQAPGEEPSLGVDPGWKPIYELVSKQLGEEKLKEYAKTLAEKGVELLISQAKGADEKAAYLAKAQIDLLGTMLSDHAKKVAEQWASSDSAKAFRERLLTITKEAPGVVVAAVIAAAAAAYLANPDLPEIKQKFDIFKGATAEGAIDVGKIQSMTVSKASAALKYSSKHFAAGLSGAYAGEDQKKPGYTAGASAAIKGKDFQFKSGLTLDPEGKLTLDLGQAIDVNKFGMETGVSITGSDMAAIVGIKIGDKDTYISGKTRVEADGKVSLELDFKGAGLEIGGKAKAIGTGDMSGEAELKGKNIFNFSGLDAKAKVSFGAGGLQSAGGSISYSTDTKVGKVFLNISGETLHGSEDKKKQTPIGFQGVLGVGVRFP